MCINVYNYIYGDSIVPILNFTLEKYQNLHECFGELVRWGLKTDLWKICKPHQIYCETVLSCKILRLHCTPWCDKRKFAKKRGEAISDDDSPSRKWFSSQQLAYIDPPQRRCSVLFVLVTNERVFKKPRHRHTYVPCFANVLLTRNCCAIARAFMLTQQHVFKVQNNACLVPSLKSRQC